MDSKPAEATIRQACQEVEATVDKCHAKLGEMVGAYLKERELREPDGSVYEVIGQLKDILDSCRLLYDKLDEVALKI